MTDNLTLWIAPAQGHAYEIDLSEFALGGIATAAKTTSWNGDYRGRPRLAREIYDLVFLTNPTERSVISTRSAMRNFFRFLDERAASGETVECSTDVTDAHGPAFARWLDGDENSYRTAKSILNQMRALSAGRLLFWPTRRRDLAVREEPVDDQAMKRFFHALRHEARSIKAMFGEGDRLAMIGSDPRGGTTDDWLAPENRIWLVKSMLGDGLPDSKTVRAAGGRPMQELAGPAYLVPGAEERGTRGVSGLLRWILPGFPETSVFFWLFLLGTGWNYSTACAVDATDSEGWAQPHPQSEKFAVIHAFKNRAGRHPRHHRRGLHARSRQRPWSASSPAPRRQVAPHRRRASASPCRHWASVSPVRAGRHGHRDAGLRPPAGFGFGYSGGSRKDPPARGAGPASLRRRTAGREAARSRRP
jgi:hypothetical protein